MNEYKVTNIISDGKMQTIVFDHPNASFPLVAVINYLSLHRNVYIESSGNQLISEEDLLQTIQNILDSVDGWSPKDNTSGNHESNVLSVLATQVNLNPYLNCIDGFGSSDGTTLVLEAIKALDIPLFHGCHMASKKAKNYHGCPYSDIVELSTIKPSPDAEATHVKKWELINKFVEATDKQLSNHGISCICDHMIVNNMKFAILYRNREFKLLCLHQGVLHVLLNEACNFEDVELVHNEANMEDVGFDVLELFGRLRVWKTLHNVNEDGISVTSDFRAVEEAKAKNLLKLYKKGHTYSISLRQRIRAEQLSAQEKKTAQNAEELIKMEERAQKQGAKKAAAANRKKKKDETSNTPVSTNDEATSTPTDMSADAKQLPYLLPSHVDGTSEAFETLDNQHAGTSEAAAETLEDQNADTSASPSYASKLFRSFLENSHYCGKSKIPYFEGEVKLMKERNLFELRVDYSHIKDDCEELGVLLHDNIDGSVHKQLEECLVQYLKDKGVENEKAENAVLKILEVPKGYQSFAKLAVTNRLKLVDCHQIYQQVITRTASIFGRRMVRGFLKVIRDMHLSGLCWNGGFGGNDMKVCDDCTIFLITVKARHNVSKDGIDADLKNFWDIISPYFSHEVERFDKNGQKITEQAFPSYFQEFEKDCKDIPDPINEPHKLRRLTDS